MVDRPTIQDLAKAAGVSVATVDRVLNGRLPVREDTALRVVRAAEDIGFHATVLLKRRFAEGASRRFGFLLQKRADAFYHSFGDALVHAAKTAHHMQVKPQLEYADDLSPATVAAKLLHMATRNDAIAVVAVDHPTVEDAVRDITEKHKAVVTLLSDLATSTRNTYIAVDARKAGRTAGWTIAHGNQRPGKVGVIIGSHRYVSQDLAEISFRSYLREHAPHLTLLEPITNLDDNVLAEEAVTKLLAQHDDIVGLYAAGGGQDGFIRALRAKSSQQRVVSVCNELTQTTRQALIDGVIDLALGTPIAPMAQRVIEVMGQATAALQGSAPAQVLFPADLHISETV